MIYDWTASKGRHNFTAIAAGEIPELNVSNNQMSVFLDVAGRPDIFVEEIVWDPPAPAVGDRVNITARAVNFGETAGRFTWGIGVNGSVLSTASASLGPGEGGNFSAQWRPALPGNYTLLAMADRTDPYELDLLNNSLEKTVQVSPAPFWVEILSPADGSRVRGLVNVSGRVHGMWGTPVVRVALGDEPAKAVTLLLDGGWSQGWNTSDLPNGRYNIAASAANGWVESMATVLVELDNPVPDAVFRPAGDIFINESEEAAFESEISWGPSLNASIRWEVNGNGLGRGLTKWPAGTILVNTTESAAGILSRLKFLSNWSSNGTYCIRAFVVYFHFELIQTNFTWNLTIKNVNTAPEIWNFSLPENFTARQKDRLNFWVEATDPEEDLLTYAWFIDGRRCETAPSIPAFNLPALGRAGVVKITLSVSDGEFQVSNDWNVTVLPEKKTVTTGPVMWPWAVVAVVCAATVIGLWAVHRRRKRPKPA